MKFTHIKFNTRLALITVLIGAVATAGCSASRSGSGQSAGEGGSLIYLEPQTFETLYPPEAGFYPNGGIVNNITDRLLYQNPQTLKLEPWIATGYHANSDATEYTFKLRDDVTYSDGTKVDAQNVVANINLYARGDEGRKLTISEAINNYDYGEVIDPTTVKFHFNAPAPGFAQAVSTINSGLVSNSTLSLSSDQFGPGNAKKIVGSGPFIVKNEKVGTELTVEARKDYSWAPQSRAHQGRAHVDSVSYVLAGEDSVRVGSLLSKQANIARQIEAPDEERVKKAGLRLVAAPTNGVTNSFCYRFRHPLLQDIRVRQAISYGIDRKKIVDTLFTQLYPLATSIIAHTAQGYEDESALIPQYDPSQSKKLLDDAGWKPGADGIREKDGNRLKINFNEATPQPRSKEVVTMVKEQLKNIGIEVTIQPGDKAEQTAASLDQNIIQIEHTMVGRSDYDVIKSEYYSKNRNRLLNYNQKDTSIGDQHLEDLLMSVASTPNEDGRIAASRKAQQYLLKQAYVLPLFEEPQVFGLQKNVSGFQTDSIGRPSFYDVQLSE